jgi:hypothetical protein
VPPVVPTNPTTLPACPATTPLSSDVCDALFTADGFARLTQIVDRLKDVIKSGGEWVSSLDLENVLSQHVAILDSVAIGVPDELWGHVVKAIIVPKEGMTITEEEITEHVKKHLAGFKKPRIIEFVDDLPVAGLLLVPYQIQIGHTCFQVCGLTGVGTDRKYRRMGYSSLLLQHVHIYLDNEFIF